MTDPLSLSIVCVVSNTFPRTGEDGEPGYTAGTNLYTAVVIEVHPDNLEMLRDEVAKRGGRILQEYGLT